MDSPPDISPASPRAVRGRTSHACDRCRLKKAKCDGSKPCGRCKAYDVVCIFNDKKKVRQKSHPPGYVELLEVQQSQLIFGLQELFRMVEERKEWNRSQPRRTAQGAPLVHDILDALGAFEDTDQSPTVCNDDDVGNLQDDLSSTEPRVNHSSVLYDRNLRLGGDDTAPLTSPLAEHESTHTDYLPDDHLQFDFLENRSHSLPGIYIHPNDRKSDKVRTSSRVQRNETSETRVTTNHNHNQVRAPGFFTETGFAETDLGVGNHDPGPDWSFLNSIQGLSGSTESAGGLSVNMDCLWPAKCPMVHLMSLNKQMSIDPAALLPNLLSTPQKSSTL